MTYRPRSEILWISDLTGSQVMTIRNPDDLAIEDRFAQSEALYFTIRADDPRAVYLGEDYEIRWRDRRFYVVELRKLRGSDGAAEITVEAAATWTRLADVKRVGTLTLDSVTVLAGAAELLTTTGWTALVGPAVPATTWSLEATDASVLDLLRKWAKITGNEIQFDAVSRSVLFTPRTGVNRGVGFRYGRNVLAIERRSKAPRSTRLHPFGRDGLSIAGVAPGGVPYLDDFSFYTAAGLTLEEAEARYLREEVWTDSSFVEDADLLAAATARLTAGAQPSITYQLSVVDLAELSGVSADRYALGDSVTVTDADLGFDVATRVVRIRRRPLSPADSVVELSYLPPVIPDPNLSGSRSGSTDSWELFETRSPTPRQIRNATTVLGRLDLRTSIGAEWVVGFTLNGIGVGTGTVTITAQNQLGETLYPPATLAVSPGSPLLHSFTFGETDVPTGSSSVIVRAISSGVGIGADVAALGSSLWVLARGTVRESVALPHSQTFTYTGAVQTFTVPDDVSEITITAKGAAGGTDSTGNSSGGFGGLVSARFPVTAGDVYDVNVGGLPTTGGSVAGWPNGGQGDPIAGQFSGSGGGSSDVRPTGGLFTAALIVAGAGGGAGLTYPAQDTSGGSAGFLAGTNGIGLDPGDAATQTAGGAAGSGPPAGTAGTQGQGGAAGDTTNAFGYPAGGGGGGWYGGGGGGGGGVPGVWLGGGGGGSGWVGATGFDVDYTDAVNAAADGEVTISWSLAA